MKNNVKPKSLPNQKLPRGWTEKKVQDVLEYYENQTEEEQLAEHEAAYDAAGQTMMGVPTELVPAVRKLIARQGGAKRQGREKSPAPQARSRSR
jgi:hypothetical protein